MPAWAVNQVRRDRPDDVRRLLDVTEELHRVYAGIASAGARERLGEAADMQRDLIRVAHALRRAAPGGRRPSASEATLNKVADTLRAAALDEELREQIANGRVVKEQRAAGLGPLASMPAPKKKGKKSSRKAHEAGARRARTQGGPQGRARGGGGAEAPREGREGDGWRARRRASRLRALVLAG